MARSVVTPKGRAARIEGLPELQAKIAKLLLVTTTGREVKRIWMSAALVLRDEARDLAPVIKDPKTHPKPWQQPGTLKKAIFAAYGDPSKPNVIVGVNYRLAPQAHWIEFGTSHAGAQPYMRPALTATRSMMVRIIAEGYQKLIAEAAA
jgi:HK97 gp10 family phage protein